MFNINIVSDHEKMFRHEALDISKQNIHVCTLNPRDKKLITGIEPETKSTKLIKNL
jgi:hypothetical protein